jgi:4-alpha-glucanotransferase
VQVSYRDIEGRRRYATPEAIVSILAALGAPVPGEDPEAATVERAIAERHRELWVRPVEPVTLAWNGRLPTIHLHVKAARLPGTLTIRFRREDAAEDVVSLPTSAAMVTGGAGPDGMVALAVPLGGRLPLGYHRLRVSGCGIQGESLLVAAPRKAFPGPPTSSGRERSAPADRPWGVFAPLYALSSDARETSLGIGDFADLERLLAWVADLGGDLVATLPLLPTFLDELFEPSPYSPVSRQFWNEVFIDLGAVPEVAASPAAQEALASSRRMLKEAGALTARLVDYRAVAAAKRAVLEAGARQLLESGSARRDELERYAAAHPRLDRYAAFRAACEHFRTPWQTWPEAAREGHLDGADAPAAAAHYHRYAQWIADTQVAAACHGAGATLLFDLPLGGHPAGFDAWAEREHLVAGVTTGAPPDPLNLQGQDWGNPPLHPDHIREHGYGYTIACIRHLLAHSGVLRIDHVMGLHRAFVLPGGGRPGDGVYLRYRSEELYAVLSLESHRARGGEGAMIVGEDLGTVPGYIRREMASHGVYRCYVAQFSIGDRRGQGLHPVGADTFASINTHDVAPFAAWWKDLDLVEDRRLGLMSAEETAALAAQRTAQRQNLVEALAADGLLSELAQSGAVAEEEILDAWQVWLARSPARAVVVSLEDQWGETAAQNVPGTTDQHPNWRGRSPYPLETICSMAQVVGRLANVNNARIQAGPDNGGQI